MVFYGLGAAVFLFTFFLWVSSKEHTPLWVVLFGALFGTLLWPVGLPIIFGFIVGSMLRRDARERDELYRNTWMDGSRKPRPEAVTPEANISQAQADAAVGKARADKPLGSPPGGVQAKKPLPSKPGRKG